jgi:hypothetical protein
MSTMESSPPYKFSNFSIDSLISPRNFPNLSPFLNLSPWLFPSGTGSLSDRTSPPSSSYYGLTPSQFQQLQLHHTAAGLISSQLSSVGGPEDLSRFSSSFQFQPSGDKRTVCGPREDSHEYEQQGTQINLLVNQGRAGQLLSLDRAEKFRLSHHHEYGIQAHHGISTLPDSPPSSPGHLGSGKCHSFTSDSHSPLLSGESELNTFSRICISILDNI